LSSRYAQNLAKLSSYAILLFENDIFLIVLETAITSANYAIPFEVITPFVI